MEEVVFTVSEITRYIKEKLEWDSTLSTVMIRGEISNFVHHSSGHMYFTLKDQQSRLKCAFFRGKAVHVNFTLENGLKVIAVGRIAVYERDGVYQFYPETIEPEGIGSLHLAFLQLKEKLEQEGLFALERKQSIPKLPRRVGLITSPTGAAVRDMIQVLTRRMPNVEILIIPASVQGKEAKESLVQALFLAEGCDLDVLIIGRGGGSLEELWPFNEEVVVRAVANCSVPVISAVGHETDVTLIDFVADKRAPTPSAAAELAVPEKVELLKYVQQLQDALEIKMQRTWQLKQRDLQMVQQRSVWQKPHELFDQQRQTLDGLQLTLLQTMQEKMRQARERTQLTMTKLDTLSPLAVLKRGYLVAQKEGKLLTRLKDAAVGDRIDVYVQDGCLTCLIEKRGRRKWK